MSVVVKGLRFEGDFGPGSYAPAFCNYCGPVQVSLPFKGKPGQKLELRDVNVACPRCGSGIHIINAEYEFVHQVVSILSNSDLNKRQVRQFERKAKKVDNVIHLAEYAKTIDPALAKATQLASKEEDPKSAIKSIIQVAKIVIALGAAATAMGTATITADDVWDRLNKGEFFENHRPTTSEEHKQNGQDQPGSTSGEPAPDQGPWGDGSSSEA